VSTTGSDIARTAVLADLRRRLARVDIEHLPPAYFSLVMATGIVSIAAWLMGMGRIATLLLAVNGLCFAALGLLVGLRALLYPGAVLRDLRSHALGPGFFTLVAGTSVLGVQFVAIAGQPEIARWLWLLALLLWTAITYGLFTQLFIGARKPPLRRGLNGVWLIAAVATQSLAVLGTLVAPGFGDPPVMLFVSLVFYLIGGMLYLLIITPIFYRLAFIALTPEELTPPYWINMGATAITTQAGATLILNAQGSPLLTELVPYLKGFTLFFWAAGTWWIPLLVLLGIWAYGIRRVPMTYNPQFWGAVFPIGMYTACTCQLAHALDTDFLLVIPETTIYVALVVWALTFAGLLNRLATIWLRGINVRE
jgi:tellurite resistance protein TehA-like permease